MKYISSDSESSKSFEKKKNTKPEKRIRCPLISSDSETDDLPEGRKRPTLKLRSRKKSTDISSSSSKNKSEFGSSETILKSPRKTHKKKRIQDEEAANVDKQNQVITWIHNQRVERSEDQDQDTNIEDDSDADEIVIPLTSNKAQESNKPIQSENKWKNKDILTILDESKIIYFIYRIFNMLNIRKLFFYKNICIFMIFFELFF